MSVVVTSPEVRLALDAGRAVVALETSVIAQGLPPPVNLECVELMSSAVRAADAVPAWVAVWEGEVRVGLEDVELSALAEPGRATKVARRDLPAVVASGGVGATTVSATIWAAHRAGVDVCATGGIGGVHPSTNDVSADLLELSRTPLLLVCSGPKSIVDPVATSERLEELGVSVVGYRCDRMPFFVTATSDVDLEHRVEDPSGAAALVAAMRELAVQSAVVLAQPVPAEAALEAAEVAEVVRACEERARAEGIGGKLTTPYLLSCLAEMTAGASLRANLALLGANARLAGEVAAAIGVAPPSHRR